MIFLHFQFNLIILIKLMDNKLKEFKNNIIAIYKNFTELFDYLDDESYVKFLYSHMNEVDVVITKNIIKGDHIICTKMKVNDNFITNTTLIYRKYLSEMEKNIIKSGEFYVTVVEKQYPKIEEGALKTDLDKFFELKNRRDFLIPMFFHKLTIDVYSKFKINDFEIYRKNKKDFFKLLISIRKYISTKDRLGTIIGGSFTLNIHDLRKSNDVDLNIAHPRINIPSINKNLSIFRKNEDVMIYGEPRWEKIESIFERRVKGFTEVKIDNYFEIIFNPIHHYYFFGIKVISLDIYMIEKANRRLPKNVADIIMAKDKLKIPVPKIRKLEPVIKVKDKTYNTDKFIDVVSNYFKRFNHNVDNVEERIKELY